MARWMEGGEEEEQGEGAGGGGGTSRPMTNNVRAGWREGERMCYLTSREDQWEVY